jgi:putrescine transport system substrate-binding protein
VKNVRAHFLELALCLLVLLLTVSRVAADEEKALNVYIWSDYIDSKTIQDFAAQTGIKVNVDNYDSNQTLETKILVGNSGYDIVVPSATPFFARQIEARAFRKLRLENIPNARGIDRRVLARLNEVDPGNAYGLPYMMSGTGIGLNQSKVVSLLGQQPPHSLALLYDQKFLSKLKGCGISLLDAADEVFPSALAFLGKDPTSKSESDLNAAEKVVADNRASYRYFNSSRYISDLASGEICVAQGWVGDLYQARQRALEAKNGNNISIFLPSEGASFNVDVLAIPKDAPHPTNAETFINFILKPEIIAKVSSAIGYANAVVASKEFIPDAIVNDPAIYPTADFRLYWPPSVSKTFDRARNRAWVRAKTGN